MCFWLAVTVSLVRSPAEPGGTASIGVVALALLGVFLATVSSSSMSSLRFRGSKGVGLISCPRGFFSGNLPSFVLGAYTFELYEAYSAITLFFSTFHSARWRAAPRVLSTLTRCF